MVDLTREETRAFVEKLLAKGRGDPGRLNHILIILKEGRQLYHSDKKYLDEKFSQDIGLRQLLKVEENILQKIQKIIASGTGDTGRLQFILEFLKQGKTLYKSDQLYLESKLGQKIDYATIAQPKQESSNPAIDALKSEVSWANQKIANLESIINKNIGQLQSVHKSSATLPKGYETQTQSLNQIQKDLVAEQSRLNHEKTEAEKIRIEQSKLTQIILDRQEFEKQVKIEQDQLQKQIAQERQTVLEQTKLVEQIKTQEAELERARHERDGIIAQLRAEQMDLASQAEAERATLAEQALAAKKIQQDKLHLETLRQENQKIMEETKSQERLLEEQVKQEKEKLAAQEKILKSITSHEKYLAETKQRQAELAQKINEEKQKILSVSPMISQIRSDQDLMNAILSQRSALEQQVRSAKENLQSIKKEKSVIEKQIKAQQTQILRAKKKEDTKLKQLEVKKKILAESISSESEKIKKIGQKIS